MWRVDDVAIRILANPSGGRATRFLYALGAVLSDLYREKQARGWPLMASDGLGWPRMASDGLGWPRMASDGLGWPLMTS